MNLRTLARPHHRAGGHRRPPPAPPPPRPRPPQGAGGPGRPPLAARRPALLLATATAGALLVNVFAGGEPPAQADAPLESVSIAQQLGIPANSSPSTVDAEAVRPLEQLAATRAERESEQTAAARTQ